jgi:hypothetical protein
VEFQDENAYHFSLFWFLGLVIDAHFNRCAVSGKNSSRVAHVCYNQPVALVKQERSGGCRTCHETLIILCLVQYSATTQLRTSDPLQFRLEQKHCHLQLNVCNEKLRLLKTSRENTVPIGQLRLSITIFDPKVPRVTILLVRACRKDDVSFKISFRH